MSTAFTTVEDTNANHKIYFILYPFYSYRFIIAKNKIYFAGGIIYLLILFFSLNLFAHNNTLNGKKIWEKINCAKCHGMDALGLAKDPSKINPMRAPRIGGLPIHYIQNQLTLIQQGKKRSTRPLGNTSTMQTKIKSLTPEDISDVAQYVHQMAPAYTSLLNK